VASRQKKGKKLTPQEELKQAQQALALGEVGLLEELSDSAIAKVFSRARSAVDFNLLKVSILSAKPCGVARVASMAAAKMEEFLPSDEVHQSVVSLYEKSAQCDEEAEWSERARYRSALLLIARNDWNRSIPHLERLTQNKKSDYYSRAIYWRARAEKSRGNGLGFKQLSSRLTKEFPIHYHSLLLSPRVLFNAAQNLHLPEPAVSFQCKQIGEEWNRRARAVEVLQELGALDIAREFLAEMEEQMEGAEAEARLYLAVLQHRNINTIGTFRVLSSLFREHPGMLSRQTLALFFPLSKNLEGYLHVAQGGGLDPFLIAALIRQESGFVTHARSRAGALGLMQLMPATARSMEPVSKRELLDGRTNVRLGVKFFRRLLSRFGGKVDHALAAYNAGPMRVAEWQRRYPVSDPVLFVDLIPIKETREYVSLISRNYYWYLQIYARHIFDERREASGNQRADRALAAVNSEAVCTGNKNPLEFSLFHSH
jgi:soluble lytic murein transglycosylase